MRQRGKKKRDVSSLHTRRQAIIRIAFEQGAQEALCIRREKAWHSEFGSQDLSHRVFAVGRLKRQCSSQHLVL